MFLCMKIIINISAEVIAVYRCSQEIIDRTRQTEQNSEPTKILIGFCKMMRINWEGENYSIV